jgi:hypothetical protein
MANIILSLQEKELFSPKYLFDIGPAERKKLIVIQTVLEFLGMKSRKAIYKCSPNSLIVNNLIYRDMPDSRPLALPPVSHQDCRRGVSRQSPRAAQDRVQGRPQTGS